MSIRLVLYCLILAGTCIMSVGCVATQGDVSSVYARQTRLEAKMDRLSKEVQALNAKQGSGTDVELREKVFQLESSVRELNQSYAKLESRVNQLGAGTTTTTMESGSMPVSVTDSASATETASVNMEEVVFNQGYTMLSEGNYDGSRMKFKEYLSKYPKAPKANDATYWIAESYYREGEFEEAILEYQRFIDSYPKDDRVPLSYLKQGMSLVEIGKPEEATLFFQTLIDKYPNSDEAKTAKEKISELAVER